MCDFYHDRLGYKGHIAEDPDSEIITATAVIAGSRNGWRARRSG